jgi:hypothetical protein
LIRWPEGRLTPAAEANLAMFRKSAAALDLEEARETWHFVHWSWSEGAPTRFVLQNDGEDARTYTFDAAGQFTTAHGSRPRRTTESRAG